MGIFINTQRNQKTVGINLRNSWRDWGCLVPAYVLVGMDYSRRLLELGGAGENVERVDRLHEVPGAAPVGALVVSRSAEVHMESRVYCSTAVHHPCCPARGACRRVSTAAATGSTESSFSHTSQLANI